jgi:predicted DNA-binding mobile mystery protein A
MSHWDKKLIREQLDKKLDNLKSTPPIPSTGWIKAIREALGMTTAQLAKRVSVNQSRITHIEQAEMEETLKLSTLNKVAEGLGMKFVYGFVPKDSLEATVRSQAQKLALKRMDRLDHTMRLELQNLSNAEKEKAIDDMVDRILIEGDKELWEIK